VIVRRLLSFSCHPRGAFDNRSLIAANLTSAGRPQENRGRIAHRRCAEAGFTLLEILVVVVILGLLIGLVAPAALRQLSGARISIARQSIERLSSTLDLYKLDVGSYPSTEDGLQALAVRPSNALVWNGPYLKGSAQPLDPWNRPYVYREPSTRPGLEYDLCSRGPSNQAGEPGADGMICNN
jgi:general secretion pathway protein G